MTVTSRTARSVLNALAGGDNVVLEGPANELLLFEGEAFPAHIVVERICSASFDVLVRVSAVSELTVVHGAELWQPDGNGRTDPIRAVAELMLNDEVSVAVIIRQAGIVLQDPSSHDLPDRTRVAALELAMADASKNGLFRNTCILLAPQANDVPEVIRGAQRLTHVHIGRPDRSERRHFLLGQLPHMHGGDTLDEVSVNQLADTYARLTDQHSLLEIESLAAYSTVMRIDVTDARRLLHTRRFGEMPDYWGHVRTGLSGIAGELATNIFGQDAAIQAVVAGLAGAALGLNTTGDPLSTENQPRLVLLFLGPTGVGKTELTKELARVLYGDAAAYVRIDMSTLAQEHAAERLTGSPPGFVGYEAGGQLTNAVLEQPCRVILLDEIEKAHPRVHDRLMSIIDDGRITDAQGRVAYFGESVIVMTSNLGARALADHTQRDVRDETSDVDLSSLDPAEVEAVLITEAEAYFVGINRREVWGRLRDSAVAFQPLHGDEIRDITERCLRLMSFVHGPKLDIDVDSAIARVEQVLAEPAKRNLGARQIRNCLRSAFLHLASWIVLNGFADAEQVHATFQPDGAFVVAVDGKPGVTVPAPRTYSSTAETATEDNSEGYN